MSSTYKARAREALSINWLTAVLCTLLFIAVPSLVSAIILGITGFIDSTAITLILSFLQYAIVLALSSLLICGLVGVMLDIARHQEVSVGGLFGKSDRFVTVFVISIISTLMISVGFVLCIVPGIYIALRLSYAIHICIDKPELTAMECIRQSFSITGGHVIEILSLDFSYIGWFILSMIGCGIPYLAVIPYVFVGQCYLYFDLIGGDGVSPNTGNTYNRPSSSLSGGSQGYSQQPQQGYQQQSYNGQRQYQQGYPQPQQVYNAQGQYQHPVQYQRGTTSQHVSAGQDGYQQQGYSQQPQRPQQGYSQQPQQPYTQQAQRSYIQPGQSQQGYPQQQGTNMNNPY